MNILMKKPYSIIIIKFIVLILVVFLQESDMFMDALTASTKAKEPRKRKRRTSITKDGPSDPKKPETSSNENNAASPPGSPTSPPAQSGANNKETEDKSLLALKPTFKVI